MDTSSRDKDHADTMAGIILAAGADKGFRSLDVFVTWFVAGTAAALGLATANIDRLQGLVDLAAIKAGLPTLGTVLILVLLSKFFGSVICTMAGSMDAAFRVLEQFKSLDIPPPSGGEFDAALWRAWPWPLRAWARATGRRRMNQGKKALWLTMLSGLCALAAAALTMYFWYALLATQ